MYVIVIFLIYIYIYIHIIIIIYMHTSINIHRLVNVSGRESFYLILSTRASMLTSMLESFVR